MKCPVRESAPDRMAECIGSDCGFYRSVCGMSKDNLAAEHGVSRDGVDANDSREKLESDVRKEIEDYAGRFLDGEKILYGLMVSMLDRQAAITDSECRSEFDALDEHAQSLERENAELKAKVDELINAVNELQKKQPYCYDPDKPVDTLCTVGRYIDELTAERDKLRDKVRHQSRQLTDTQNALENRNEETKPRWKRDTKKLQNKIDKLTAELAAARKAHAQAEHEAVILREKLGRMLDNAHEITRIGGDC